MAVRATKRTKKVETVAKPAVQTLPPAPAFDESTDEGMDLIGAEMRRRGIGDGGSTLAAPPAEEQAVTFAAQPADDVEGMPDPNEITYAGIQLADEIAEMGAAGNGVQGVPGVYAIPFPREEASKYTSINFHLVKRGDHLVLNEDIFETDENGYLIRGDCMIGAISMNAHRKYREWLAKKNKELLAAGEGETLIIQRGPVTARA